MSPRYGHGDPESIDVCSLNGYIQLIANTFSGDEKLMPIVQNFMYIVLDKDKINLSAWGDDDRLSEEDCIKLDEMRAKFSSIESTTQFLQEQKKMNCLLNQELSKMLILYQIGLKNILKV